MSDSYGTNYPSSSTGATGDNSGTLDAAKHEAADLKQAATAQAKDVLSTTKDEAASVVGEAKTQVKDLYAQSMRELKDQAATQQHRISSGLQAVGDQLSSMAARSEGSGVAGDLVAQVSTRLTAAAGWLGDRDPASVLTEVKQFARRKPGSFILGALVAGIAVGRLTRALAANASDDKEAAQASPSTGSYPALAAAPVTVPPVDTYADTPIYAQAGPGTTGELPAEGNDGRANAF